MLLDTTFDFRTDAHGKDADTHNPTLRRYHRALWSKPLPSGRDFDLDGTTRGAYLNHRSQLGEFWLSSDSVIPTFSRWIQADCGTVPRRGDRRVQGDRVHPSGE